MSAKRKNVPARPPGEQALTPRLLEEIRLALAQLAALEGR